MHPSPTEVRGTLQQLRRTPQHFKRTASGLTDEQLRQRPAEDGWSVHEVLAHLRGAADVQGGWIARMLGEDAPTIRYASPRTGMRKTGHEGLAFEEFLRHFTRLRNDLVNNLAALELADWSRSATFTGTTPGWSPTVLVLASGIATHEQAHFEQITATAARLSPRGESNS